jgi:hypothetical protein
VLGDAGGCSSSLAAPAGSRNRRQQQWRQFDQCRPSLYFSTHLAVLPAHVLWAGVVVHAQLLVGVELEGSQDAVYLPLALRILQVAVKLLQAGGQAGERWSARQGRQAAQRNSGQGRQAGFKAGGSQQGELPWLWRQARQDAVAGSPDKPWLGQHPP